MDVYSLTILQVSGLLLLFVGKLPTVSCFDLLCLRSLWDSINDQVRVKLCQVIRS